MQEVESVPFKELFSETIPDFTKYSLGSLRTGYIIFLVIIPVYLIIIFIIRMAVSARFRNSSRWEMFMQVNY